jgi:hypothetical protein
MAIDLQNQHHTQTALFVKMTVPDYAVLKFSNYNRDVVIEGNTYTALGNLLGVTDTSTNLRVTPGNLSITISGIPNTSITDILNNRIKGSDIEIWRVFFDVITGQPLLIDGNPLGRFKGIVSNYSIQETWDPGSQLVSNTIMLTCSSTIDVLNNKISGRSTNSNDQKYYYPTDLSMDRVAALANSNFNFGAIIK